MEGIGYMTCISSLRSLGQKPTHKHNKETARAPRPLHHFTIFFCFIESSHGHQKSDFLSLSLKLRQDPLKLFSSSPSTSPHILPPSPSVADAALTQAEGLCVNHL